MIWIENNLSDSLQSGATFTDPDGNLNGYILFYEGEIRDGTGSVAGKRLFGFYTDENQIKIVSPAIIWDLAEGGNTEGSVDVEALKKLVSNSIIPKLEGYKEEILRERNRQAGIKEKYGIKSLDYLIVKLDGDLITLGDREWQGENVDLAIRNKEERKEGYEKALIELKKQIQKEKSLVMSMPRFVGMIKVKPAAKVDTAMKSDAQIEAIGMKMAMEYERSNERDPEDVSAENLGFDIRSRDKNGNLRYIEVKARAETGAVSLTQNEWFKAKRFKNDYYLYAVMNAAEKPELYIIQNPAENLEPEEKVEVVRYVVPFKELAVKGKKA